MGGLGTALTGTISRHLAALESLAGNVLGRIGAAAGKLFVQLESAFSGGREAVAAAFQQSRAEVRQSDVAAREEVGKASEEGHRQVESDQQTALAVINGAVAGASSQLQAEVTSPTSGPDSPEGALRAKAESAQSRYRGHEAEAEVQAAVQQVFGQSSAELSSEKEKAASDLEAVEATATARWEQEGDTARQRVESAAQAALGDIDKGQDLAQVEIANRAVAQVATLDTQETATLDRLETTRQEQVEQAGTAEDEARQGLTGDVETRRQEVEKAGGEIAAANAGARAELAALLTAANPGLPLSPEDFHTLLEYLSTAQLGGLDEALAGSYTQAEGAWDQGANNFSALAVTAGQDAATGTTEAATETGSLLETNTADFGTHLDTATTSITQQIGDVGSRSAAFMEETGDQMQLGLTDGMANVAGSLEQGKADLRTGSDTAVEETGDAMHEAADAAAQNWLAATLSSIGSFLSSLWAGLRAVFSFLGNAFVWLLKNIANLLWGFVWGEPWFKDVGGASVFAFIGDLIAGILVIGDIRDIIKYWIVYPLQGKGPWWLLLLLGGISVLGLIPLFGDALKASVKQLLKGLLKTAGKELAEKLGKELAERLIRELGEEAAEKLVRELGEELVEKLAKELGSEAIQELAKKLGKETLERLADKLGGKAIQQLVADLGDDVLKKLAADLGGEAIQKLVTDLGAQTVQHLAAELSGKAIQDLVRDLGADIVKKLANELGGKAIQDLVRDLGADVVKNLARELGGKEIQGLIAQHGADVIKWLGKDLGGNAVKDIVTRLTPNALAALKDISGKEVKELLDDLGEAVINDLAAALKGAGLLELRKLGMFAFDPAKVALLQAGQGAAVRGLPQLLGKTRAQVEAVLQAAGFIPPNFGVRGMEIWTHADGSIVRIKLGPEALKGFRKVEHLVKEISKTAHAFDTASIFAKVADNGAVVPAGIKFAEEQLKQWFKRTVSRLPNPAELEALMRVWADAGHVTIKP